MTKAWQNIANFLEYFGLRSPSYYHTVPDFNYDPQDILAYYLDMTPRADYRGPFDSSGMPLLVFEGKAVGFPTLLIMYALGHLEKHRRQPSDHHVANFRKAADWLTDNQHEDGCWLIEIPSSSFKVSPPFRSAMVQGLGMSVLVRAATLFDSEHYVESATRALAPFHRPTSSRGVATIGEGEVFYEEYPCRPACHVLNGFFYAMWGLYDLMRYNHNEEAGQLWQSGLETVIKWLPEYDLGYWSLYHIPAADANPATVAYHRLHVNQLAVMQAITAEPVFEEYHALWQGYLKKRLNAIRALPTKLRWLFRK